MKIKNQFVLREVGGESVVVPVGEMSKDFHGMINLNETGAFLWKFFSEEHTVDEAVAAMLEKYDAEESLIREDVEQFVKSVEENGFCVLEQAVSVNATEVPVKQLTKAEMKALKAKEKQEKKEQKRQERLAKKEAKKAKGK